MTRREGSALLLTISLFVVLSILAMAFFRTTQDVRRDATITYLRLHAQSGLENSLIEALSRFNIRVNQAAIKYKRRKSKRSTQSSARQHEVTKGNDAALKRFLSKHEGKRQVKIARVSERNGIAFGGQSNDSDYVEIPADPWYTLFRESPADFDVESTAPHATSLLGKMAKGLSFQGMRIRVVALEQVPQKEKSKGIRSRGLVSVSAELKVGKKDVNFDRRLEYRYRFILAKSKAPSCVQDKDYSRVYLQRPPIATFLNRQLVTEEVNEEPVE